MTSDKLDAPNQSSTLKLEVALHFRDQLRAARAAALRDAEAFPDIVFVLERLGAYLIGRLGDMGQYCNEIAGIAAHSPMAVDIPAKVPHFHQRFDAKYDIVRNARNSALHQGAFARHLTSNAVELSLVVEEGIMRGHYQVGDFMVGSPVCAYLWQPLSFIRQTMLVNSFSFLPVPPAGEREANWRLVSDFRLAQYLRVDGDVSKERLAQKLEQAVESGQLELHAADTCNTEDDIKMVLGKSNGLPAVVLSPEKQLMGILTPFDLL